VHSVDWGDEIFFVHGTADAPPTTAKFHSEVGSYKLQYVKMKIRTEKKVQVAGWKGLILIS
jgi:hypothetical protein